MNERAAIRWTFIGLLIAVLSLTGCASRSVSRAALSKVSFGNTLQEVEKTVGKGMRTEFRAATTNGVLEMKSVYCEETRQHWKLLFVDNQFTTSRADGSFEPWGSWPGFTHPAQSDFTEISWFWMDFFPAKEPRMGFDTLTNLPPRENWFARNQGVGMMIGLAPALPFAIVALPAIYVAERPMLKRIKSASEIRIGMEDQPIITALGEPKRRLGSGTRWIACYVTPPHINWVRKRQGCICVLWS